MTLSVLFLFVAGLGLLLGGADILVRGATRLARGIGISPLVVGLTVVAFGTSAPEMAVSVQSALGGQAGADLAIGNVVGSNILNVLLILGISAAIAPLAVAQKLVRFDVPLTVCVSILVFCLALDGVISHWNGLLLFAGIMGYTIFAIVLGRREEKSIQEEYHREFGEAPRGARMLVINALLVLGGLGLLVLGAQWLVEAAITTARTLAVSEVVIGLTVVAAGTSLPEMATSVLATLRGERDIAVGNVIGSNLFNLLAVLGLAALASPTGINVAPSVRYFDLPVMMAAALACLPIFFTGYAIARWEGWLFLGYYAAYTAFVVLAATRHDALDEFGSIMLFFVVPLTVVTLAGTVVWQMNRKR